MTILCPTRGGKESHSNQDFAIYLTKERATGLTFLYVSNIQLLSRAGPPIIVDIEEELDEVGSFLLSMAQERAEKSGVIAKAEVRRGNFSEVLRDVIIENKFDTVILGRSSKETGIVPHDHLQELSNELSKQTGAEFIIVQGGQEVFRIKS